MPYKTDSDWAKNKKSPDIVYTFVDSEEVRYHKENGHIYEIITTDKKTRCTRRLPVGEMSIEEFDALKKFSDESLHDEDIGEIYAFRGRVPMEDVENTIAASTTIEGDPPCKTLEDAMRMVDALGLTPVQRRRFLLYCKGMSTYEIAEIEGVDQKAVWFSIEAAMNKRKNFLRNLLSDTP